MVRPNSQLPSSVFDIYRELLLQRKKLKRSESFGSVLFADLCGSTRMKLELGLHEGLLRTVVHNDAANGIIVKNGGMVVKYIGDEVMAFFGGDKSYETAIACARAVQQEISKENRKHKFTPPTDIHSKIGINFGPVVLDTSHNVIDPYGSTVDLAARIVGIAKPDQILIHKNRDYSFSDEIMSIMKNAVAVPFRSFEGHKPWPEVAEIPWCGKEYGVSFSLIEQPVSDESQGKLELAEELKEKKNYSKARKICEELLKHDPWIFDANRIIASICLHLEDFEGAQKYSKIALAIRAEHSAPYATIAWAHHDKNELTEAVEWMDQAWRFARRNNDQLRECWNLNNLINFYTERNETANDIKIAFDLMEELRKKMNHSNLKDLDDYVADTEAGILLKEYQNTGDIESFRKAEKILDELHKKSFDHEDFYKHQLTKGKIRDTLQKEGKIGPKPSAKP